MAKYFISAHKVKLPTSGEKLVIYWIELEYNLRDYCRRQKSNSRTMDQKIKFRFFAVGDNSEHSVSVSLQQQLF